MLPVAFSTWQITSYGVHRTLKHSADVLNSTSVLRHVLLNSDSSSLVSSSLHNSGGSLHMAQFSTEHWLLMQVNNTVASVELNSRPLVSLYGWVRLIIPSARLSSSVQVPQENFSPFPSDNLASAAAVISDANCSICSLLSSLEWLSALFHMPGQCTIFILYWERKSLMRITALFTELCIQRKFK